MNIRAASMRQRAAAGADHRRLIPIPATSSRTPGARPRIQRGLQDWFVCDIDAHHVETVSWKEIVTYIEDPVVRDNAMRFQAERIGAPPYGLNGDLGLRYQSVGGRIPHQDGQRETSRRPTCIATSS